MRRRDEVGEQAKKRRLPCWAGWPPLSGMKFEKTGGMWGAGLTFRRLRLVFYASVAHKVHSVKAQDSAPSLLTLVS